MEDLLIGLIIYAVLLAIFKWEKEAHPDEDDEDEFDGTGIA